MKEYKSIDSYETSDKNLKSKESFESVHIIY